jgi:hypothetical protein
MKPLSWDKQLGLRSPLESAASQSDETNHPSKNEVGLDVSHHTHVSPEGRGKYFFLDILFHRISDIAIYRQQDRIGSEGAASGRFEMDTRAVSA